MGSTRRAFTREFKREAVKLATESGHPTAQVARDLGLTPNLLRRVSAIRARPSPARGDVSPMKRSWPG